MQPDIRAMIAASAHALVTGKKVAGLYDHTTGRHRRIAAEAKAEHLQGYDGDRDARFGGTLPELHDAGAGASIFMEIGEDGTRGYDRSSSRHFSARIAETMVQLYDHAEAVWFAFDVKVA